MQHLIDYQKIADAQGFYRRHGFQEIHVPWIVGWESYAATRPTDRKEFYTLGGYLNASGEQSFLELMLSDIPLKKHMTVTPCFRDEPVFDNLHQQYFVKLELIDTDVSSENLSSMIALCKKFFDQYLPARAPAKVVPTDPAGTSFDIVDGINDIELGSYGIRQYRHLKWIYATGIALPRLDIAIENSSPTHVQKHL